MEVPQSSTSLSTKLSVEELKAQLLVVKKIEEERVASLETMKKELEQRNLEQEQEMSEEDRLILRTGQGWVSQLEQKITDMQKEMQRKQRAQELRKRELLDEQEAILTQLSEEVEQMRTLVTAQPVSSRTSPLRFAVALSSLAFLGGAVLLVWTLGRS